MFKEDSLLENLSATMADPSRTGRMKSTSSKKSAAMSTLKTYEAICTASVLEDCADQLAVLGAIMPGSYEGRRDVRQVRLSIQHSSHYMIINRV